MISTITTATVSILTTGQFTGTLSVIVMMVLLILLVLREFAMDSTSRLVEQFNPVFKVGIIPFLFVFLLIVLINVSQSLY